jgi:subtilisin family serine protease
MMKTDYIAPGASKFGLDASGGTAFDIAGTNLTSSKAINVINMSYGLPAPTNNWYCNNGCGIAPTTAVYNAGIAATATDHNNLINYLNGVTSITNLSNFSNAVIINAAGNDNLDTKYSLTALALSGNTNVASRLLVVGALDKNGTVASPATKASYSNYAGSSSAISDRFVMANGTMPWTAGSVKIGGTNFAGDYSGTSFAAPLVAGYAAIVMQKFPNLSAASTSNIILDTARTDTLSCHPSCSSAIYGKGEASLSRALAPVGSLR